jgi:hypothetical protein
MLLYTVTIMTKKIYYERVGRRYRPVAEYNSEFLDSYPRGTHMVICHPGSVSRRYDIDPALAPMIAAGIYAKQEICSALVQASEMRPARTPITPEQHTAWQALATAFGDELATLHGQNINDIADAGVAAMQREAQALLEHPAVRKAYDHFLLVCELTRKKESSNI